MHAPARNIFLLSGLFLLLSCSAQHGLHQTDAGTAAHQTLASLVRNMPEHRVIHGWGQVLGRFPTEGSEYIQAIGKEPAILSDYLSIQKIKKDPTVLAHASLAHQGRRDPKTGAPVHYIPMICVVNHNPRREKRRVTTAVRRELGITPSWLRANGLRDFRDYKLDQLAGIPSYWAHIRKSMLAKGYILPALEEPGPPTAHAIRQIAAQAVANAMHKLKAEGYIFRDMEIAAGKRDEEIVALAQAIREVRGPVLIRFMQETIGGIHRSDVYGPESYKSAWIHFVTLMRSNGADNAEFVFHPNEGNHEILRQWWPGDAFVDWVAGSFFQPDDATRCQGECDFAAAHGKPYMIAESAPTMGPCKQTGTEDPGQWDRFFMPYFDLIHRNDNLKMFVYINIDWRTSSMFGFWPNTQVQANDVILAKYIREIRSAMFLHNEELFQILSDPGGPSVQ